VKDLDDLVGTAGDRGDAPTGMGLLDDRGLG
jgi:hypothetical protein